ncbi:MAG: hypothetical protein LBF93_00700 [Zoogloeaceae bacterium]|jgi:hypothetical protein|nr:hypothetical protein [Zoogloeaceae bacterium]
MTETDLSQALARGAAPYAGRARFQRHRPIGQLEVPESAIVELLVNAFIQN